MIDRSRGMIWYRIFQGILVLWIISGLTALLSNIITVASGNYPFPIYSVFLCVQSIALVALSIHIFNAMRAYDAVVLDRLKMLCWLTICDEFFGLSILLLESAVINDSVIGSAIGASLGSAIVLIPTYFYLKKRFNPYWHQTSQNSKDEGCAEHKPFYVPSPVRNEPIELVSSESIDPICSENHLDSLSASEPPPVDRLQTQCPVLEKGIPTIRFCRHCGNELRSESKYCDNCGKKVRK